MWENVSDVTDTHFKQPTSSRNCCHLLRWCYRNALLYVKFLFTQSWANSIGADYIWRWSVMVTHAMKGQFNPCKLYPNSGTAREKQIFFFTWFKISNVSNFLPSESWFFSCWWNTDPPDVRPVGLNKKCLENSYLHKRENVDLPLLTCPIRIAWKRSSCWILASALRNGLIFSELLWHRRTVCPRVANTVRNELPIACAYGFGVVTNYAYNRRRYGSLNIRNENDRPAWYLRGRTKLFHNKTMTTISEQIRANPEHCR